jgi:hypothetical protein
MSLKVESVAQFFEIQKNIHEFYVEKMNRLGYTAKVSVVIYQDKEMRSMARVDIDIISPAQGGRIQNARLFRVPITQEAIDNNDWNSEV